MAQLLEQVWGTATTKGVGDSYYNRCGTSAMTGVAQLLFQLERSWWRIYYQVCGTEVNKFVAQLIIHL